MNKQITWEDLIKGSAEYESLIGQWTKNHDCIQGETAVKDKGDEYLPAKGAVMKQEKLGAGFTVIGGQSKYEEYKLNAPYINFSEGTQKSFVGALVRKPAEIENLNESPLKEYKDDIDMGGMSIQEGIARSLAEDIKSNMAGIMIGFPKEVGVRTYPVLLEAHQVLDYHREFRGGKLELTFVKLKFQESERNTTKTGYDTFDVVQIFRLEEGANGVGECLVSKFRQPKEGSAKEAVEMYKESHLKSNGKIVDEIPVKLSGNGHQAMMSNVCNAQIYHYVAYANLKKALNKTAEPINAVFYDAAPLSEGDTTQTTLEGAVETGLAGTDLVLPVTSRVEIVEYTGAGISSLREDVRDHEDQIHKLGAFHLMDRTGVVESDAALRTKNTGQLAGLNVAAHTVAEMWTWALNFLAKHYDVGGTKSKGDIVVNINRDYLPVDLDPQVLKELKDTFAAGCMPLDVVYHYLQRTDALPKGIDSFDKFKESTDRGAPVQKAPEAPEDPILEDKEPEGDKTPKDEDK